MSAPGWGTGLPLLPAELGPGVLGGFTTRAGGTSAPPWQALNLGLAVGDEPRRVLANRDLLARAVGTPVAFCSQRHGADVRVVHGPPAPSRTSVGDCDALVADSSSVAVAVLVADCVPVLLADADAGLVAAVHAGRRGVQTGVVAAAVATMAELGAEPARLRAVVGPAVCGACYEVPAAMQQEVAAVVPAARSTTGWGTPALDLPAAVTDQLLAAGVGSVAGLGLCTMTDQRFYSHRRASAEGHATGRSAAVVRLLDR